MAATKKLYTMASKLGLVERSSKEDAFHQLVYGLTGKEHVSELTPEEEKIVLAELQKRLNRHDMPKKPKEEVPGMITIQQQNLAWRLIYRLAELEPTHQSECERLIGAIRKILGITVSKENPFRWINFDDGTKLIEQLKRYVRSAERKAAKKAGAG